MHRCILLLSFNLGNFFFLIFNIVLYFLTFFTDFKIFRSNLDRSYELFERLLLFECDFWFEKKRIEELWSVLHIHFIRTNEKKVSWNSQYWLRIYFLLMDIRFLNYWLVFCLSQTFHFTNLKEYGSSANTYLSLLDVLFPLFGLLSMHHENVYVCNLNVLLKKEKKYSMKIWFYFLKVKWLFTNKIL